MPIQTVRLGQPQDQAELDSIQRRRQLAEMLSQQSMEPVRSAAPNAPVSWTQGLAKVLKAHYGKKGMERAEQEQQEVAQRSQERTGADTALLAQALQGRPAQPAGLTEDPAGNVTQQDAIPAQTPVQSLGQAIPMMGQGMQPVALQAMMGAQGRQDQQDFQRRQSQESQAWRSHESELSAQRARERQLADQAFRDQQARQAASDREGLARMQGDARQQRQPQVIQTADGPMVLADDGTAKPIIGPNGPVRPSQGRVGPMTATAQKELIETEEAIQGGQAALSLFKQARALNDKAMGFTGAGAMASVGSLLPEVIRPGAVDATQNLDNILQTAALPQLKAIFGGMPTEGERKILLDVQGSSSKPPSVRKEIFDRAERAIQARLKFGTEKVKRLREGTYFSGEGLPSIQMEDGPTQVAADPLGIRRPINPRMAR